MEPLLEEDDLGMTEKVCCPSSSIPVLHSAAQTRPSYSSREMLHISSCNDGMEQTCRLLKLPAEIRNRICELALIQEDAIWILSGRSEVDKRALLRT